MNRTIMLRLFAVITPLICLTIGGWLAWGQYHRGVTLEEELSRTQKNIEFQKSMISEIGSQPLAAKEPAVPVSDAEQAAFLEGLRQIARGTGVELTKWSNLAAPVGPDAKKVSLPGGVTAVLSNLEVSGPYSSIRNFLYEIAKAPRLLNFSSVKWSRSDKNDNTKLSVTITRYVSPSTGAASTPTSPPLTASKESPQSP